MVFRFYSLSFLLCLLCLVFGQQGLDLYSDVYGYPCVTLLNKDKVIGCTGPRDGASGPLWPIRNEGDLQAFYNDKKTGDKILLLNNNLFNRTTVESLIETKRVTGILVPADGSPPSSFSPAERFPNQPYGLHSEVNYVWNPFATEETFNFDHYKIPIFSLAGRRPEPGQNSFSSDIIAKAEENRDNAGRWPQWGVHLKSFMIAGTNSEICLSRSQDGLNAGSTRCDPVGGRSIWGTYSAVDSKKDILIVSTKMDSNAFFHDLAIGADSTMSGVIASILAAQHLKDYISNFEKQVIFTYFTGESYGYIGSTRFVNDIHNFVCNQKNEKNGGCSDPPAPSLAFQAIRPDKIVGVIEVDQVGNALLDENDKLSFYIHRERNDFPSQKNLDSAVERARRFLPTYDVSNASSSTPGIPPSSLMSFIAARPQTAGIVLTEYDTQYINKYYQSRFDRNISVKSVCAAAETLAQIIYEAAKSDSSPDQGMEIQDCEDPDSFASQLVYCLTYNISCDMARMYFTRRYFPGADYESVPNAYTSIWRSWVTDDVDGDLLTDTASFISQALFDSIGTNTSADCGIETDCPFGNTCIGGKCFSGQIYHHNALSLAIDISTGKINKDHWNSKTSTWTESVWSGTSIQVFKMDSPTTEIVTFLFGLFEMIAAFPVVWLFRRYFMKKYAGG